MSFFTGHYIYTLNSNMNIDCYTRKYVKYRLTVHMVNDFSTLLSPEFLRKREKGGRKNAPYCH